MCALSCMPCATAKPYHLGLEIREDIDVGHGKTREKVTKNCARRQREREREREREKQRAGPASSSMKSLCFISDRWSIVAGKK